MSCLPALDSANLIVYGPLAPYNVSCLLEALASRPALTALDLYMCAGYYKGKMRWPDVLGCAPAFAKLRSLKRLALELPDSPRYILGDVVEALVSLTGLTELMICLQQPAAVPAALRQLKALQELQLCALQRCNFEAGCLDLPNLQSLRFRGCHFIEEAGEDVELLPSDAALQGLTSIDFFESNGPPCFAQLARLPRLQRMDFSANGCECDCLGLSMLPADMGTLSLTLTHLDISRCEPTYFPLALTRLVALKCLKAGANEFAEVPDGITALARLTKLTLGRWFAEDPLQLHGKRSLDVCALGDLSAFPALCKLTFKYCQVVLSESMLGVVRHASLASLVFRVAHPAPGCMLTVLQLSQALRQHMHGGVLRLEHGKVSVVRGSLQSAPFTKFDEAIKTCEL